MVFSGYFPKYIRYLNKSDCEIYFLALNHEIFQPKRRTISLNLWNNYLPTILHNNHSFFMNKRRESIYNRLLIHDFPYNFLHIRGWRGCIIFWIHHNHVFIICIAIVSSWSESKIPLNSDSFGDKKKLGFIIDPGPLISLYLHIFLLH